MYYVILFCGLFLIQCHASGAQFPLVLEFTQPLTDSGDIASNLISNVDRFLLKELDRAEVKRRQKWETEMNSKATKNVWLDQQRIKLKEVLGIRGARRENDGFKLDATTTKTSMVASNEWIEVHRVSWEVHAGIHGEGLLLHPKKDSVIGNVIAIPDADLTPEALVGLVPGLPESSQYARVLAENGFRVIVPNLINRAFGDIKSPSLDRGKNIANREFLYRPCFELGRPLVGIEVEKILSAVDTCINHPRNNTSVSVVGWGEGGALALYASAIDPRIKATIVSGYFENRNSVWKQPIDRTLFGLLENFGDAEIAALVQPRLLIIESGARPSGIWDGKGGGAPAILESPDLESLRREFNQAQKYFGEFGQQIHHVNSGSFSAPPLTPETLGFLLNSDGNPRSSIQARSPVFHWRMPSSPQERHARQMNEINRHSQELLEESPYVRRAFMKDLDTSSLDKFKSTSSQYRNYFYEEVVGRFTNNLAAPNPRSRKVYDEPKWVGYEVKMDVFEEVFAYGLLLLPKDLRPGEKRPVVVCQHGLEGRPQHTIGAEGYGAYAAFSAKLAERGFIVFAPQNLYIFTDRFRTIQRKAYPLKKTLFSIITPQHQQIINWLRGLQNVDPERIAFYGLSYGGKTAMRVPALLEDYCLSICSADFNEWVWKNASTRSPYSYVWTGEYEIFEYNLGSTFNYSEMASLIAPRPFMVERGHFDGVAPDETVAYEFGKVRHLYAAKLGLGDRVEIEWFVGPHTINGKASYEFLHRHLRWPKRDNP